ncbi:transposable element Tcb2 transposase [Trichonephila clavipes]|nr:transposable element Tcb2 transposase [Trichonephila clavipes]
MTAQLYVHDILPPHVLPLMQRLPVAIFQQDNAWPLTTSVSQTCLRTVSSLPWSARSPDLSPIEHIWGNLVHSNFQIPVLIRCCNSGMTCAVTSVPITIILDSLSKPGDDSLEDFKFLGYFQLGTPTFPKADNSTT